MAEAMFFFTKRELTVIMTSIQTCQSLSLLGSCKYFVLFTQVNVLLYLTVNTRYDCSI